MSYTGGKGSEGTAQFIVNQQPPHDLYIEPFAGHAAVARLKRPAQETILIDRDPEATSWLKAQCLGRVTVFTTDALLWLAAHRFSARTLIYCDPPYILRSRDDARTRYRFELTDEDHVRLLRLLVTLPCMVQISAYDDSLYGSHLQSWRHLTFQGNSRGGPRTEHLWMNYPEPQALHTYDHLGRDYRERERIKKKVRRWQARLRALPGLERLALYSAMSRILQNELHPPEPLPAWDPGDRSERLVTVLFADPTSHYKTLPAVECYDRTRDARTWPGGTPVVAHPPCAQWGRLRGLAKRNDAEKALGPWAVDQVRANGGVLEHPAGSSLWPHCNMPAPGPSDSYGGFTLDIDQVRWGHKAQKHTWLYVCGCELAAVPPMPPPGHVPTHSVTSSAQTFYRLPELSKRLRELTPPDLCRWLVELARRCERPSPSSGAAERDPAPPPAPEAAVTAICGEWRSTEGEERDTPAIG